MQLLLFLAFAASGMAGLIYEVIWSRYLALFVGHSAYAQVLVIAVYLGGLALGALVRTLRLPGSLPSQRPDIRRRAGELRHQSATGRRRIGVA